MKDINGRFARFVDLLICIFTLIKRILFINIHVEKRNRSACFQMLIAVSCFILIGSCESPALDKATELINKSIEAHGGMDQWKLLDTISYRKEITLYNKEKTVRKYIEQQHDYNLSPSLAGRYSYIDSIPREVVFDGKSAYKVEGGVQKTPGSSAFNSFNSAYYVLNMPWKLLDEGAHSTYEGLDTLFDGQIVETIRVDYTSGTTKDLWWYYFDPVTHRVVACLVSHPPTYNLITNDDYISYQGLLWNHKRSSYRSDENGEIIYLMGKYQYVYADTE